MLCTYTHTCLIQVTFNLQHQFVKQGGQLLANMKVVEIVPGDVILIRTDNELVIKAKQIVLTVGKYSRYRVYCDCHWMSGIQITFSRRSMD